MNFTLKFLFVFVTLACILFGTIKIQGEPYMYMDGDKGVLVVTAMEEGTYGLWGEHQGEVLNKIDHEDDWIYLFGLQTVERDRIIFPADFTRIGVEGPFGYREFRKVDGKFIAVSGKKPS